MGNDIRSKRTPQLKQVLNHTVTTDPVYVRSVFTQGKWSIRYLNKHADLLWQPHPLVFKSRLVVGLLKLLLIYFQMYYYS